MTERYFATVARGLEEIAARELSDLGATDLKTAFTGVCFSGDRELLYRVNLWARTIFRILRIVQTVPSADAGELYRQVQAMDWGRYLTPDRTYSVRSTGGNARLNHSHYTALTVKSAIADWQARHFGSRSNVDVSNPDIAINAHVREETCAISLDSSGESLHRRGYRPAMGLAPLKETLAAALIHLTEWTADLAFFDPMCGSGVLPIEAALKGLNVAPGLYRQKFGFQGWLDYDDRLWQRLVREARQAKRSHLAAPIFGTDADGKIIEQASSNAFDCGVGQYLQLRRVNLAEIEAPATRGTLICNPPYGKRLGNTEALGSLYRQLGDILKHRFKGWTAFILSGNKELTKQIGLRSARRSAVYNGAIPCTFLKYELY